MQTEPDLGNENSTSFDQLDLSAKARINAQRSEARQQLEFAVIGFLESKIAGGVKQLVRNPNSEDLLPFFDIYAGSVFDAEVGELLPLTTSLSTRNAVLQEVVHKVVQQIWTRPGGVWTRTVSRAFAAVDFCSWTTQYGEFNAGTFIRPKRHQLKARLQVHARRWETEFWSRSAGECGATHIGEDLKSEGDLPAVLPLDLCLTKRVEVLQSIIHEYHWSNEKLAKKSGVSRGTILNILRKKVVDQTTLATMEEKLNESLKRPVRLP